MGKSVEVDRLVELAQEVELNDPIDWSQLTIDRDTAYTLIAYSVVEQFDKYSESEREVMLATITKLVVENFTLNLKLQLGK